MPSGKRVTVPRPVKGVPKRKGAPSIVEGEASTSSHGASPSNKAIALLRVPAGPYTSHTADGSPIALSPPPGRRSRCKPLRPQNPSVPGRQLDLKQE